jgi:hypothetical protein
MSTDLFSFDSLCKSGINGGCAEFLFTRTAISIVVLLYGLSKASQLYTLLNQGMFSLIRQKTSQISSKLDSKMGQFPQSKQICVYHVAPTVLNQLTTSISLLLLFIQLYSPPHINYNTKLRQVKTSN